MIIALKEKNILKYFLPLSAIAMIVVMLYGCKEKYALPKTLTDKSYLVVEGYINTGGDSTHITLSRSVKLDTFRVVMETDAVVVIESNSESSYHLQQTNPGVYSAPPIATASNEEYKLTIKTVDNKTYESDWVETKFTPEIDSVSWTRKPSGVLINVNTHDTENKSKYYLWKFEETWDFYSHARSDYDFYLGIGMGFRGNGDSLYHCWQFFNSKNLILASTAKFSEDLVYRFPLTLIPNDSWKISSLYSILVKQRVLSKDAYEYLEKLKKNSEQLGTIFDPQPSTNVGNIRCVTNPREAVLGCIYTSSETEKRIFINRGQVIPWRFIRFCEETLVPPDSLEYYFLRKDAQPMLIAIRPEQGTEKYWGASVDCMDCRLRGVHKKPDYWP